MHIFNKKAEQNDLNIHSKKKQKSNKLYPMQRKGSDKGKNRYY